MLYNSPTPRKNYSIPSNWPHIVQQAPVVQHMNHAIHRTNLFPVDNTISFPNTYPFDSDLSDAWSNWGLIVE